MNKAPAILVLAAVGAAVVLATNPSLTKSRGGLRKLRQPLTTCPEQD
jgi:hypothetical protein